MTFPTTADTPAAAEPTPTTPTAWAGLRPVLLRVHFYAGVLIAPFLLVAAVTGLLYAASHQIEKVVYADQLTVAQVGTTALPLSRQIDAARAAHPEGSLALVRTSDDPEATTQVLLNVPGLAEGVRRAVFVDPYTAEVRGALESFGGDGALPIRTWLDKLHANLLLGEPGRIYSELAASWLWVVALGGLALWIGRRRTSRRALLLPERAARGRRRSLSWHGVVGLWATAGLLGLSVTGLTWSTYAGANIEQLRTSLDWSTPVISTKLGTAPAATGEHSGHEGHGAPAPAPAPAPGPAAPTAEVGVDQVLAAAAAKGLDGPLELVPPKGPGKAYVVKQTDKQWPVRLDQVAVDPADGRVVSELRYADYPLGAKLTRIGIDTHTGLFLGLANQLALMALAGGLIVLTVLGYRMWWQRRPTRATGLTFGRPYPRGAWRQSPKATAALALTAVAVGWFLPLLGIPLAAFLLVDLLLGLRTRGRATTDA
ncbi:PepSY domain-containing protein [Kitasatospora sp. NPDC093806]|uniref:PepSY-associated TM helix domain-containing protein n=1 Tax=Kitasatospora sp. NPDC093806 TaxID=3155075 RepID=UPI00343CAF56